MNITEQLEDARANVERLERAMRAAPCAQAGHDMQHKGGRNAGCSDWCSCSVPVFECTRCGDCDYGENEEARAVMKNCKESR